MIDAFDVPLRQAVLPDDEKEPADWTLADWQGLLEEFHYQSTNDRAGCYDLAHAGLRWLIADYLARRLNT